MKRARQLRPAEVDALVAHYRAHGSVVAAAKEAGVTRQTAGRYLALAGINTVKGMSRADITQVMDCHARGESASSIGRRLGFSTHTVLKAIRARV